MPLAEKSRLIFWQNVPSLHQAPLMRALAERFSGEVVFVAERGMSERREALGWSRPEFAPARLIVGPAPQRRLRLLEEGRSESVHIFSGFQAEPGTYATLKDAVRRKLDIGVFAESPRRTGLKGRLRRVRYSAHAIRWARHLKFLLTTGNLGVEWYRSCGFPEAILFPFAYFVEPVSHRIRAPENRSSDCRFLFVGQLIERKGVDLLLRALGGLDLNGWRLDVVGDGPASSDLRRLASRLGIDEKVRWRGVLPNAGVRALIGAYDCLVLPSRHDGWGAVVNEALLGGTPVIASDAAGASDLIQGERLGRVFPSESMADLADALRARVESGLLGRSERRAIRSWARNIAPGAGADYLLSVLQNSLGGTDARPVPPWKRKEAVQLMGGEP